MKKIMTFILLCFVFHMNTPAQALTPMNERELQQYVSEFGWTVDDLRHYLSMYDRTLADFSTMEELKRWLGDPVTEEGLTELLLRYHLTEEELEALLGQFGETVQDYTFMNDLRTAVDFYMRHNERMQRINDRLSSLGFTEEEAKRFFDHMMSLRDETMLQQLDALSARIDRLSSESDAAKRRKEAIAIWKQLLDAIGLQSNFYFVTIGQMEHVSADQLAATASPDGRDLLITLSNKEGERIIDLQLPKRANMTTFILHAEKDLLDVGKMAHEMKGKLLGEKMPNTASPYVRNMMAGLLLMLGGVLLYVRKRVVQ